MPKPRCRRGSSAGRHSAGNRRKRRDLRKSSRRASSRSTPACSASRRSASGWPGARPARGQRFRRQAGRIRGGGAAGARPRPRSPGRARSGAGVAAGAARRGAPGRGGARCREGGAAGGPERIPDRRCRAESCARQGPGRIVGMARRTQARSDGRGSRSSSRSTRAGSARSRRRSAATSKRSASTASTRSRSRWTAWARDSSRLPESRALPRRRKPERESLAARVAGPAVVAELLAGIVAVESLADAIARRKSLQAGQSVITRNGIWLGRDWVRVARSEAGHAGVIAREQELKALHRTGSPARKSRSRNSTQGSLRDAHASRGTRRQPRRAARKGQPACTTTSSTCAVRTRRSGRRRSRSPSGLRACIEELAQIDARRGARRGGCRRAAVRASQAALERQARTGQSAAPVLERERDALKDGAGRRRANGMPRTTARPSKWPSGSSRSARRSRRSAHEPRARERSVAPAGGASR